MASILVRISDAELKELAPQGVHLNDLLVGEAFHSADATVIAAVKDRGYVFRVSLRPDGQYWLAQVLEDPVFVREDISDPNDGWIGGENLTGVTDVTGLLPRLSFARLVDASSPGALLAEPRLLTEPDEQQLIAFAPPLPRFERPRWFTSQALVDARGRSDVDHLRLDNYRRPRLFTQMNAADCDRLLRFRELIGEQNEFGGLQALDVVDVKTGQVVYYLYWWPYSDGVLMNEVGEDVAELIDGELRLCQPNQRLRHSLMVACADAYDRIPALRLRLKFADQS